MVNALRFGQIAEYKPVEGITTLSDANRVARFVAEGLNWSSQKVYGRNDAGAYDYKGSAWLVSGDDMDTFVTTANDQGFDAAAQQIAAQKHRVEAVRFDKSNNSSALSADSLHKRKS